MDDNYEAELFGSADVASTSQQNEPDINSGNYDYLIDGPDDDRPKGDQTEQSGDFIDRLLKNKGIDRNKVRFSNDDGDIEEYTFDELSDDEKYDILSEYELPITDQEIADLNELRTARMNLNDYTTYLRDQAVKEYLAQNQTPTYEVDTLSDDEVFALDLMQRFGDDITDEEIDAELEKAKEDEDRFTKRVGLIRNKMKNDEDIIKQQTEAQEQEKKTEEFNAFVDEMVNAAQNVTEIQGVELEDSDRNQILDFLLKDDAQGATGFSKLLRDPEQVFRMAWFALYGDKTFETTLDYFKQELAKARKGAGKPAPRTVRRPSKQQQDEGDPYDLDSIFK